MNTLKIKYKSKLHFALLERCFSLIYKCLSISEHKVTWSLFNFDVPPALASYVNKE